MASNGDLIDFNVIEGHKENIQALPSGRSAKALAQLYSPPILGQKPSPSLTNDEHAKERAEFEKELKAIDEADDPLDIYDRYVKWTLDTYPSAQSTPQSQLVQLLERATRAFQNTPHYQNDARYLRLWLQYIGWYSDAPREIYSFLARHGIGRKLALYYEEFAAYLESIGRWNQAEEIYKMGIENEAHPTARLLRKFGEFEQRKEVSAQKSDEPSSPALPTVRPALAAKLDPFHSMSPSASQQRQQPAKASTSKKSTRSKMQIFSDADSPESRPGSGGPARENESIATLAERKRENRHESKPWAGEKLKTGKTNGGMEKIAVFRDLSSVFPLSPFPRHLLTGSRHEHQWSKNPKTGLKECIYVNLEAIYPGHDRQFSLEELVAQRRGLFRSDWSRESSTYRQIKAQPVIKQSRLHTRDSQHEEKEQSQFQQTRPSDRTDRKSKSKSERGLQIFQDQPFKEPVQHVEQADNHDDAEELAHRAKPKSKQRAFEIFEDKTLDKVRVQTQVQTLALNDENDENKVPSQEQIALAKQLRKEARQNRTRKIEVMDVKHISNETKTIQLNMDSPPKTKVKRKKSVAPAEPTMTITTKEAMDEIYDIFNEPLESQADSDTDDDGDSDDDDTSDVDSTATGKLSGHGSEYGEETRNEIFRTRDEGEENDEDEDNDGDEDNENTNVTGWTEFTLSKHAPGEAQDSSVDHDSATGGSWDLDPTQGQHDEQSTMDAAMTPVEERPQPLFMPQPPEDYQPPIGQYRDAAMIANQRLPFMTPIVEQTETSLAATTIARRSENDYYNTAKTPSRNRGGIPQHLDDIDDDDDDEDEDEPCSSPFQDESFDLEEDKRKILMPIRTKSTKGTLSLGKGSAKNQIEAKIQPSTSAGEDTQHQKGPLIKDLQCNPMDPNVRLTIISQMKPALTSYEGYFEHADEISGRGAEVRRYVSKLIKAKASSHSDKTPTPVPSPPTIKLEEAHGSYTVRRELGAGTFAPVYLVENSTVISNLKGNQGLQQVQPSFDNAAYRRPLEAIKMEDPPNAWEFFIIRQCHRRLGVGRAAESIVRAHEMHLYSDECFLIEDFRDQGTLLDLVNTAKADAGNSSSGGVDEVLAMWLSAELLRTVEALHSKQLIHGDLKADNILVRFDDPGSETDWSSTYFPSGAHGWSSKGVCLIDFGRGIDMKQFSPNVGFIADWKTTEADCTEMRELRPWTYQVDYYGLAGIIHTLLFGKYMETIAERGAGLGQGTTKTCRIRESLKRYWQTEIWGEAFALLLNPLAHLDGESDAKMPICNGLRSVREKMEGWLEENCERGLGLKGMVSRMELAIREKRRKGGKSVAC